jgi:hypothetical protein
MTKIEIYWFLFRSKVAAVLLDLAFYVMPNGMIKDALLKSMESTLDRILDIEP